MAVILKFYHPHTEEVQSLTLDDGKVSDEAQARSAAGWVLLSRQSGKTSSASSNSERGLGARAEKLDTAWWCRELKGLLLAGMTVVEAIDTLKAQNLGAARNALHAELVSRLQEGQALSLAMKSTQAFPVVLVAGVKASERTSTLVSALENYLRYHEMLDSLKKKVISAAIYPSIVLSLGLLIVLFLLAFVIPRFAQMYNHGSSAPGEITRIMLVLSQAINHNLPVFAGLLLSLVLAIWWTAQQGILSRVASELLERIPPIRRQIHEFRLAKLYQSMALMVRGGYAVAESLEQCSELELGPGMRERLLQARSELEHGRRVSAALVNAGLTDTVTARLLAIAERTGNFDLVLQTVSQRHAASFSTFIDRTTRVVEPAMLLAASLLVGGVVVMMYMPVFDIAGSIK